MFHAGAPTLRESQNDDMRPIRLDALIRVSRLGDRDARDLRSPDQQRGVIARWAERHHAEVVREHVNIGLSGKTVMGRSDIEAVLERVRHGATDGLWPDPRGSVRLL
jgi:hypothetical protein